MEPNILNKDLIEIAKTESIEIEDLVKLVKREDSRIINKMIRNWILLHPEQDLIEIFNYLVELNSNSVKFLISIISKEIEKNTVTGIVYINNLRKHHKEIEKNIKEKKRFGEFIESFYEKKNETI